MTAHPHTLLAKLAAMFGAQTEDLAVEALRHILSRSEAAREVLSDLIAADGATVGEITHVRTRATAKEGEPPDLVRFDRDGRECALIEATSWAGLIHNQPVAYLDRLPMNTSAALLFVAPAARLQHLWAEFRRSVGGRPSLFMRVCGFKDSMRPPATDDEEVT